VRLRPSAVLKATIESFEGKERALVRLIGNLIRGQSK
jgi:hypothetical protein